MHVKSIQFISTSIFHTVWWLVLINVLFIVLLSTDKWHWTTTEVVCITLRNSASFLQNRRQSIDKCPDDTSRNILIPFYCDRAQPQIWVVVRLYMRDWNSVWLFVHVIRQDLVMAWWIHSKMTNRINHPGHQVMSTCHTGATGFYTKSHFCFRSIQAEGWSISLQDN